MIDHVAAYGGFANGGRRLHPWGIAKVTDSQGRVLEDNRPPKMEQAIPRDVATRLTDILKGSEKPSGWNTPFPVAMKSGTTEHWTDSWYVGYTTDLVVGAWMGHTDSKSGRFYQNRIYGENGAGLILRDFVKDWYQGKAPAEFPAAKKVTCTIGPAPKASAGAAPSVPYQRPDAAAQPSPTATALPICPSVAPTRAPSPGASAAPAPAPAAPAPSPSR
jgi:membrane peptidoglycan carboxypeptidase